MFLSLPLLPHRREDEEKGDWRRAAASGELELLEPCARAALRLPGHERWGIVSGPGVSGPGLYGL